MVSARQTVSQFPQKNSIRKKFCVCVCILPLTEAGAASPAKDQTSAKTGKPARLVPIFPRQSELCHGIHVFHSGMEIRPAYHLALDDLASDDLTAHNLSPDHFP